MEFKTSRIQHIVSRKSSIFATYRIQKYVNMGHIWPSLWFGVHVLLQVSLVIPLGIKMDVATAEEVPSPFAGGQRTERIRNSLGALFS
jgi:hypothetical protein